MGEIQCEMVRSFKTPNSEVIVHIFSSIICSNRMSVLSCKFWKKVICESFYRAESYDVAFPRAFTPGQWLGYVLWRICLSSHFIQQFVKDELILT